MEKALIPQNCGTCYNLSCPTNRDCGACGVLKGFPNWIISVEDKQSFYKRKTFTEKQWEEAIKRCKEGIKNIRIELSVS